MSPKPEKPPEEQKTPEPEDKGGAAVITSSYATKKSAAQGMLDLSLMVANGTMLSSVAKKDQTGLYLASLILLILSIILQVVAGVLITVLGFRKMKTKEQVRTAETLNNTIVVLSLLITVVNVLLGAFGSKE